MKKESIRHCMLLLMAMVNLMKMMVSLCYLHTFYLFSFNYKELPVIDDFSFQLLSSVIADPPVFSLSFNVTDRSPTNVTCSIDGSQFNIPENDLMRTVIRSENNTDPSLLILVQVSVIVRVRVAGLFQCNVTTDKITSTLLTATTPAKNITGKIINQNLMQRQIILN